MSDLPKILVCEDDPIYAKILCHQLKQHYQATHVASGEECIEQARSGEYCLILLDIMLPGMDGYTTCEQLRQDFATADIPVIFLSANFGTADRLRGYEAGGFDYLVKPAAQAELLSKISIILRSVEEKNNLKENVSCAMSTAMTAMSSQAEMGLVLHFFKTSFTCMSYDALAQAILTTIKDYSLDASVQLRGRFSTVNMSGDGPCSPLEASVLSTLSTLDRIVDLGARTAISYENISIIIKNMPRDDPDRNGRLKDHLVMLAEGADARVRALDADLALDRKAKQMLQLVRAVGDAISRLDTQIHSLHARNGSIFSHLISELEHVLPVLELSVSQEKMLENAIRIASTEHVALAAEEASLDRSLYQIMETLQAAVQEQRPVQA